MNSDDFRISSNWDGDLSLTCPDCYDSLPIKHNGTPITKLREIARQHLKTEHPDVYLIATKHTELQPGN